MKNKLDDVDYKVLELLSNNAQLQYTEVAKLVGVSSGTVHSRINKMKSLGLIKGATLSLDYSVIGWQMTVFLGIYLREAILYREVIKDLNKVPEIVKIHHSTGKYDVFVKMHAKDSLHYRQVYQEEVLSIKGIKGVESFISVEENLCRHISFK